MITVDGCKVCDRLRPIAKQNCDIKNINFIEYKSDSKESESYDINGIPQFILEESGTVVLHGVGEMGLQFCKIVPTKY